MEERMKDKKNNNTEKVELEANPRGSTQEEKRKEHINPDGTNKDENNEEEEFHEASDKLEEENTIFTCEQCDFGSNISAALDNHIKATHKETSPDRCSECSKKFKKTQ